jgi:hypothetical protein
MGLLREDSIRSCGKAKKSKVFNSSSREHSNSQRERSPSKIKETDHFKWSIRMKMRRDRFRSSNKRFLIGDYLRIDFLRDGTLKFRVGTI